MKFDKERKVAVAAIAKHFRWNLKDAEAFLELMKADLISEHRKAKAKTKAASAARPSRIKASRGSK